MPNIVLGQIEELEDPKLLEIAKHVFNTCRLAFEKAVAHLNDPTKFPMPSDVNALEHFFLNRFKQLNPEQQKIAIAQVLRSVNAKEAMRKKMYKNLAAVDLKSAVVLKKQVASLVPNIPKLNLDDLKKLPIAGGILPKEMTTQVSSGAPSSATTKKLELVISRVKCVDETGAGLWSEWTNADNIQLGGTAVTGSTGDTQKISAFKVGDFNDGTIKDFNPSKSFCLFDTTKGNIWPKSFFATFVLVEKDNGGTNAFVEALSEKVKTEVTNYMKDKVTGNASTDGSTERMVMVAIIAKVVEWFIGIIKDIWYDDVFPPKVVSISIPSATANFNGKKETETQVVKFKDHNGYYRLYYNWRLVA